MRIAALFTGSILALSVLDACAQVAPPLRPAVFSAAELSEAGVLRLSDLFLLLDGWNVTTIDGFTWQAGARGLGLPQESRWKVMLDGQPIDLNLFGTSNLNRVPVSLGVVDSIEVVSVPQIHDGEFVDGGLIHIHTSNPRKPFLAGRSAAGNETGDPGPFRYTAFATPNVDKIGPDLSAEAGYGAGRFFGWMGAARLRHYATDEAIRTRNLAVAAGGYPQITIVAPFLRLGEELRRSRHEFYFGFSEFEDFYFLGPFGREVPVIGRFAHAGLRGVVETGGMIDWTYRVAYTVNEIDRRDNALDLDFDWKSRRVSALVQGRREGDIFIATGGAGFDGIDADTHFPLESSGYSLARVFAHVAYRLPLGMQQCAGAALIARSGDVGLKTFIRHEWPRGPRDNIAAVVSYVERRPEEENRIWYWSERGYRLLEQSGVSVDRDGPLATANMVSADLGWSRRASGGLSFCLSGYYRRVTNSALEDQTFQFDPMDQSFQGPVRLVTGAAGAVGGLEAALDAERGPSVRVRLHYRYQEAVSGSGEFRSQWQSAPGHHLRCTAKYSTRERFTVWSMLRYTSASDWENYRASAAQSGGVYSASVKGAWDLHLALQKWFWKEKLRGSIVFRNVLNEHLRYHPIGASFDLSAFAFLEVRLD